MKIVIATPLYPPDIAPPAIYVKHLTELLSKDCELSVITYGRYPEEISGVNITTIDKKQPLIKRLFEYMLFLKRAMHDADIVYAQNGASVELPLLFASLFEQTPYVLRITDRAAHERAKHSMVLGWIERLTLKRARTIIVDALGENSLAQSVVIESPLSRPEILPFIEQPDMTAYERSWTLHVNELKQIFAYEK